MAEVLIGFGGNLGDSIEICRRALDALGRREGITVIRVSSLYRTKPVGVVDQGWFVNGAALCETSLGPEELLAILLDIEKEFGRERKERWGPRTLDLDILSFGGRVIEGPSLTLPHPRLHERLFVLKPLAEIAPNWIHPSLGLSVEEMLDRISGADQEALKLDDR